MAHFAPFKNAFSKEQITPLPPAIALWRVARMGLERTANPLGLPGVSSILTPASKFIDNKKDCLREQSFSFFWLGWFSLHFYLFYFSRKKCVKFKNVLGYYLMNNSIPCATSRKKNKLVDTTRTRN